MTPNQITVLRVLLAFGAVGIFAARDAAGAQAGLLAVGMIVAAIGLDGVDGWVARRKNLATPLGAQLDILGDRVIENLLFTYFAVCGLISLWVPVLFFVRGNVTDFVRSLAARAGAAGFGANSMMQSWWGRALVASRASRAAYGVLKCACFCWLGMQLAVARGSGDAGRQAAALGQLSAGAAEVLVVGGQLLVIATVAFCVVRGVPVVWEGRRYLAPLSSPQV